MSIGDVNIVLEEGLNEFHETVKMHVDLKVAIMNTNAPRMIKPKNGKIHSMKDFLPKDLIKGSTERQQCLTPEEQVKLISERGHRAVNKANAIKQTQNVVTLKR